MNRSLTSERLKENSIPDKNKRENNYVQDQLNFKYNVNKLDNSYSNSSSYKSGDKFIGQQAINEMYINKKYFQQTQQQIQSNLSQTNSSQSNFQDCSRVNKQEFDTANKQNIRSSVNSDNQNYLNELGIKEIHKVEIDPKGVIKESYNKVLDQNDKKSKQSKDNYVDDKYRQEYEIKDNSRGKYNNTKQYDYESKINILNSQYNYQRDDSLQNAENKISQKQQNCNNVSFDDNGENFMTEQTDNLSQFNTKQTNKVNRFSSVSSSCTALYQKKIDEVQQELKEKISFLIVLEEELLDTKTQLNMQKIDNSSLNERISKLQTDNQQIQKQTIQMGEIIKNLEKASNSLNDTNLSRDGNQNSQNSLDDSYLPFTTHQEYINNIVQSNISLKCNLEELNQKYSQLKTQINSTIFTHSLPIQTRAKNAQLETTIPQLRSNFLRGETNEDRQDISPNSVLGVSRSQSPIQSRSLYDNEKHLIQNRSNQQQGLLSRVNEIKEANDKFVSKYLKTKRRYCKDELERQFYVEMDNEFELIRNNLISMEQFFSQMKQENEVRVKNSREQFQTSMKEIEQIKKIAEERNKMILDQVKQIEQENIHLNKTVKTQKDNIIENEQFLDQPRMKIESYSKPADDSQNMLVKANENLVKLNQELEQYKLYREKLEEDLNDKINQIKDLKLENSENTQFIRQLQKTINSLQKEAQEKQDTFTKDLECAQKLKQECEKKQQFIQHDALQVQQKEKEHLEKEIKMKEKENQLLYELSQRDKIISSLSDQIKEINSYQTQNKIEHENNNLKTEINNLMQIKKEFENNFQSLQNQIMDLKIENKELKNEETERKLWCYDKYVQIEQKLGLQQTDVLLLIEKLPLAEQELQTIVVLNENLTEQLNNVIMENLDYDRQNNELKRKFVQLNQEMNEMKVQSNIEREFKNDNMIQQIQLNQQLQKQNQTIMQNNDVSKTYYSNLEIQISDLNNQIFVQNRQQDDLNNQIQELNHQNDLLSQRCAKYQNCLELLMKERELIKLQQSQDFQQREKSLSQQSIVQQLSQKRENTIESSRLKGSDLFQESQRMRSSYKSNNKSYENYQENISPVLKNYKQTRSQKKGIDKALISSSSYNNLNNMSGQEYQNNFPLQSINSTNPLISNRQSSNYSRNLDLSTSPSNIKKSQQIYQDLQQLSANNRMSSKRQYTLTQPNYSNQSKIIYY